MSYKLKYLPSARKDMVEIVRYISKKLHNPYAANSLAEEMIEAIQNILAFPYATPVFHPIRPLKYEYRKIIVQNYVIFYWIDEEKKEVIVARVIYTKRNYGKIFK